MDAKELALRCAQLADNKKAENIVVLDLRGLSSVADYFVIATGNNDPHLRAIVDEITQKLRERHGLSPHATEGARTTSWVVLDYIDVIVHAMHADTRDYYDLDSLWGDAPRVELSKTEPQTAIAG